MSRNTLLLLALLSVTAAAPLSAAVQLRIVEEVEYPVAFDLLSSVRELADGRVLAADPVKQVLGAIDMDAGTMEVWGAEGSSARQYRQPDAVHAFPGDSTLLVDLGNSRLTIVAPDGSFARNSPMVLGGGTPVLPRGVDSEGRIYFSMRNVQNFRDSSRVGRVTSGSTQVETMAKYKPREVRRSGGGGQIRMEQVPMSLEDDWAVGSDGTIALVRSDGYYVEVIHPDGSVSVGPPVDHRRITPGDAEKRAWLDAPSPGPSVMMTMGGGAPSMQFHRSAAGRGGSIDEVEWPELMPSFRAGSTRIDPEGRIWVGRHTRAGDPSLFDIFDAEGRAVGQVTLDPDASIAGFGADGAVYTTQKDEEGRQRLKRQRLETTSRDNG